MGTTHQMGYFDLCFWARKWWQLLWGLSPSRVSVMTLFSPPSPVRSTQERRDTLDLNLSRFLKRMKQFVWTSALLRIRQGEFRVWGTEKGCHLELAWDRSWENALGLPWDSRGVRVVGEIEAEAEVSWGRMEKLRKLEETGCGSCWRD